MAELGFVGDGPNSYQLWLGGSPHQTRLAAAFQDRVKLQAGTAALSYAPTSQVPKHAQHAHLLHHAPCQMVQLRGYPPIQWVI
jgi:sulfite reductase beta subunit-like hemoprotein